MAWEHLKHYLSISRWVTTPKCAGHYNEKLLVFQTCSVVVLHAVNLEMGKVIQWYHTHT